MKADGDVVWYMFYGVTGYVATRDLIHCPSAVSSDPELKGGQGMSHFIGCAAAATYPTNSAYHAKFFRVRQLLRPGHTILFGDSKHTTAVVAEFSEYYKEKYVSFRHNKKINVVSASGASFVLSRGEARKYKYWVASKYKDNYYEKR